MTLVERLVSLLPVGREYAMPIGAIADTLKLKRRPSRPETSKEVEDLVREARLAGYLIGSDAGTNGFYIIETAEEFDLTTRQLRSRARTLNAILKAMDETAVSALA